MIVRLSRYDGQSRLWTDPPSPNVAHLWLLSQDTLAPSKKNALHALLSPPEVRRCEAFRRGSDRERFATARGFLRLLLGRICDADPRALAFRQGPHGKPEMDGPGTVSFNLSHAGDHVLVGLAAPDASIGVDVEARRPVDDLDALISCLHPEEAATLASLDPLAKAQAFVRLWTCKEAVLKATGQGLSLPLEAFWVDLPAVGRPILRQPPCHGASWLLWRCDTAPGLSCAVALVHPTSAR